MINVAPLPNIRKNKKSKKEIMQLHIEEDELGIQREYLSDDHINTPSD
jgi:hypothetical protein